MPPKSRPKPPQRYVYVIGPAVGLQKIGLATDPQARLAALKTASPYPLVLHAAVPVAFGQAHAVEARAHQALASRRGSGEWFDVAPSEAVAAVKEAAEPALVVAAPLPLFAYSAPARARQADRATRWHGLREACRAIVGAAGSTMNSTVLRPSPKMGAGLGVRLKAPPLFMPTSTEEVR